MPRRKCQPHDNRPDWRDPNMPVLMMAEVDGKVMLYPIKPDHVTQYYAAKMNNPYSSEPEYKNDPTYDLKKKKKV